MTGLSVFQIATPYQTGNGFLLPGTSYVVTHEHIVRDCATATLNALGGSPLSAPVVYVDMRRDLALLDISKWPDEANFPTAAPPTGRYTAFGMDAQRGLLTATGDLLGEQTRPSGIDYLEHNALLKDTHSGGPLLDPDGKLCGINSFLHRNGAAVAYALPERHLREAADLNILRSAVRCLDCDQIAYDHLDGAQCLNCERPLSYPHEIAPYESTGIAKTIEEILERSGYDIATSRRGRHSWSVTQGSARIQLHYSDEEGILTGDAYLCRLNEDRCPEIYEYLLRENFALEGLSLSVHEGSVLLSLLIHDAYLHVDTGTRRFAHLCRTADVYDETLVREFGCTF